MTEIDDNFIQALLTLNRLEAKRLVARASGALTPLEIAEGMMPSGGPAKTACGFFWSPH